MSDAIDLRPTLLLPDWPAPANVRAFVTTRETGPSQNDFAAFNPATHVGDNADHVALCRRLMQKEIGDDRPLLWLNQTHGARVQQEYQGDTPEADAALASSSEYACVVLTADCLPVLLCNRQGTQVAVAHAGWRGLAGGVLEATVAAMNCDPSDILVWLGPAISNAQFEVGPEVYGAFVAVHP
ncbi:MAG: laccase domain-containing protein, partial [Pseudomonadota bacterium]